MNLPMLARKLRQIADLLEEVLTDHSSRREESPEKAQAILRTIKTAKKKLAKSAKKIGSGFNADGLHWTQRPENKEKLREMTTRAAKTRNKNKAAAA